MPVYTPFQRVPFIVLSAFTVLNLFIGIIVDAMQSQLRREVAALRTEGGVTGRSQ